MTHARETLEHLSLSTQINARIEGLPVVGWQARVRLLLGVITFFEAFDLLLISFTLPLLKQQWQLDPTQVTLIIGSGTWACSLVRCSPGPWPTGWGASRCCWRRCS